MSIVFEPVRQFERWLAEYTGAPYAVAVYRCATALEMCCSYLGVGNVTIPAENYFGVAGAVLRGGGIVECAPISWRGAYRLNPYPIWDSARRLRAGMYNEPEFRGELVCVSFHRGKILGYTEGGGILTDSWEAADWFRAARDDGRPDTVVAKYHKFNMIGWAGYMVPEVASGLLQKAQYLPDWNEDLPNDPKWADLSKTDWNALWKKRWRRSSTESRPSEMTTTSSSWPGYEEHTNVSAAVNSPSNITRTFDYTTKL